MIAKSAARCAVTSVRRALPSPLQAEFDQFMLLSRNSVRSLLSAAVPAQDTDPSQFALWGLVLLSTLPSMYAFRQMVRYSALGFQTANVIDQMIQVDRMFFLLYGMLVAALVAATTWDALLPDRVDQEIIGSLPVRPRTFAAARLGAALWAAAVASAAVSIPPAVLLAIASPSHPALGYPPAVLGAHVLATQSAGMFAFILLLIMRALIAVCLGARTSERLATAMQVLTIAGLAEVFFFIPGLIPALVERLASGDRSALLVPSMPFAALYAWLVGAHYPSLGFEALTAPLALAAATALVVPLYLRPARVLARRALESHPHRHVGLISSFTRRAAMAFPLSPAVRSLTIFTVTTLLRSRRHRLIVSAYLGLAIAIGTASVTAGGLRGTVALDRPAASILAVPLVLLFFTTLGLRAAFAVPSDVDANWTFRLSQPPLMSAVHATTLAMLLLSTIPVLALTAAGALLAGWSPRDTAVLAGFDALCGAALIESILRGWRIIPFTCGRPGDVESVKSRWLGQVAPLLLFVFVNAGTQNAVLRSDRAAAWYAGAATAAVVVLHVRRRLASHDPGLLFEASPADAMATLSLSEALS